MSNHGVVSAFGLLVLFVTNSLTPSHCRVVRLGYTAPMANDRKYMVLSAVGADRPGLIEKVASLIHQAGGNLEDSRMAILGGEFALILLFSGPHAAVEKVQAGTSALAKDLDLTVTLRPTVAQPAGKDFLPYRLRVSGMDRPGIVARVSTVLSRQAVNVSALDSKLAYAPESGTPMFQLECRLQVPSGVGIKGLRAELGSLCEEENLDFALDAQSA
jgi:glycine cleavage system transcriptional repressor